MKVFSLGRNERNMNILKYQAGRGKMTDYSGIIETAIRFAKENQVIGFAIDSETNALVEELVIAGADEYEVSVAVGQFTQTLNRWPQGCVEAMDHYRSVIRQVKLNLTAQTGGCPTKTPEPARDFPDPMTVKQFAQYIGRSVQWCYNHSHELPKTQEKPGGKMVFYKKNVDRWQEKHLNKGV